MEIIVLIKQVPATELILSIAEDGKNVKKEDVKWVLNPYDEFAVEEALRIQKTEGGTVTLVSVGPDKAQEAIRHGLAMGADKGVLVNDPKALDCDGLATAKVLASVIDSLPYDLIIAGQRAVDDDNYLVGTAVAEFLDIPNISLVIKQEISDNKIKCHRTIEGGTVVIESPLPVLLTTQRGLNEPRYTSMPGIMKAKKKKIEIKSLDDLDIDDSSLAPKTKILSMEYPPERQGGRLIEGDSPESAVAELVKVLREEAKVI
ncbi:electron transfer flavoprotein subunit beta/FixA family protein [Desulfobacterales bacterium HSG16]|nr:electron transfer flavoprotein subunit beta/FixA family protein [Desulfobacterales bacterium HSG16]